MKVKTKNLKRAIEAFFRHGTKDNADSVHSRTQNQPKKHLPPNEDLEDENEFIRQWDDTNKSDLQLKLKDVYFDLMKRRER